MTPGWTGWVPALILALGSVAMGRLHDQAVMPLARPLTEIPPTLLGLPSEDVPISAEEQRVAGMDRYLLRIYAPPGASPAFSVYVGYYQAQQRGQSIHSPRNCLPGAGWEPVSADTTRVPVAGGEVVVNRYLLEKQGRQAMVYYWYQGRGRVAWNEYRVKYELLRDKALLGRSEEALVRVVVPVDAGVGFAGADSVAASVAALLVPQLDRLLPPLTP